MFFSKKALLVGCAAAATLLAVGVPQAFGQGNPPIISIVKEGAHKESVSLGGIRQSGPNGALFYRTLVRDLKLSGWFEVSTSSRGSVNVTGVLSETGVGVQTALSCAWAGRSFGWSVGASGTSEVRRRAHQFADEMVKRIKNEKGIASSRIVFVNRRSSNNADLYVCDADGQEIRQLTQDHVAIVGPRWAPNASDIYYTSFIQGYPTVLKQTLGGGRKTLVALHGLNTGAAISPDGSRAALILSYQGNPELYVLTLGGGRVFRMTNTRYSVEASPCWSPNGRQIVYVSDVSRRPQLYIVDVATRRSRRLTYRGSENVNPDWNEKGKIVYATKDGGSYRIAVLDPAAGSDSGRELIDGSAGFEHPSWAPDSRHVVCSNGSTLYMLDTLGDPAERLVYAAGRWISPDWSSR